MKFNEVNFKNFQAIEDLTWRPNKKITAIIGENGKGKTSFLKGVRGVITGDLNKDSIRDGEDSLYLGATLEDGTTFSREIDIEKPTKVRVNDRATTGKSLIELLESETGVGNESMKLVSSSEALEKLNSGEFGNFLLSYIPEELDVDIIKSYISDLTPEMNELIDMLFPPMPVKFKMDTVEESYKHYFETRRDTKKEMARRKALIDSFVGKEPTRDLKSVSDELENILKTEGALKGAKTALAAYNNAVNTKKKHKQQIENLSNELKKITATKPNPKTLTELNDNLQKINTYTTRTNKTVQTMVDSVAFYKTTVENLDKPVCPISDKLICKTDRTDVKEDLLESIKATEEAIVQERKSLEDWAAKSKDLNEKIQKYQENSSMYEKKLIMERQLHALRNNEPKIPPKPAIVKITDYTEEKRNLQKEKDQIIAFKRMMKETEILEALEKELATYDALVKAFSSKGEVMDKITKYYLDMFESIIEERTEQIRPDFKVKFESTNGVQIMCEPRASSGFRKYEKLSSGEKIYAMFLILDMLNELSGLKILIIDNLEQLDINVLNDFLQLITSKEVQDAYDHILIATVNHDSVVEKINNYISEIDVL